MPSRPLAPQAAPPALFLLAALGIAGCAGAPRDASLAKAPGSPPPAAEADAASRSDAHTRVLLDALARFDPESIGEMGVDGLDEQVSDLAPGRAARFGKAMAEAIVALEARAAGERDPAVRQDVAIAVAQARLRAKAVALSDRLELPFTDALKKVFAGIHALLADQVPPARRAAALVRLRRYTGLEPGYAPLLELAQQETAARLGTPGLLPPLRAEVEQSLGNTATYLKGIEELFARYRIAGAEEGLARLRAQAKVHDELVRAQVLPRARTEHCLPPVLYSLLLEINGVDMPRDELVARAHRAFAETRAEMTTLAARIAKERGLPSPELRAVLAALKREQVTGDALVTLYQRRIAQLEQIVRDHDLVTLPARPMRFRVATAAETAREPAPHIDLQGIFAKKTELTFVLPLAVPAGQGPALKYDDFTSESAAWPVAAHEGRPGHDLQLSIVAERGLSMARLLFAFNAANVEGWGLYAERLVEPHVPLDGRLALLQLRLVREARAFLDPELQSGAISLDEARRVLEEEIGVSPALAKSELDRYTFLSPAQATAYFYGYTRMLELRAETERAMGARFRARAFHDFVLAQGLLPPPLLRQAVLERFVGTP